jgi:uncharacterized protein YndB with AHSA1/START domain
MQEGKGQNISCAIVIVKLQCAKNNCEVKMRKLIDEKVSFSTLVRVSQGRAYDAITTAEGLDAWFTTGASVDARPGGKIIFRWKDWGPERYTGENGGSVLEAKWPEHFIFQWKADSLSYDTTVEIYFEPTDEGTVVTLSEYGFEDSPAGLKDMLNRASGWAQALTLMKFYLEHGMKY